jgi:ankyrin repeat protein
VLLARWSLYLIKGSHVPCMTQVEFWRACLNGDLEKVKDFVARGGNVNWVNNEDVSKRTALQAAACLHNSDCVKVLIDAGGDVHGVDSNGFTALHWAASFDSGDVTTLDLLLSAGCPLNAVTSESTGNHTPLHFAARFGALRNVEFLLECEGIDVTVKNRLGLTAAGMAEKYGKAAVFSLLRQPEVRCLFATIGKLPFASRLS